jgi:hypothetical protein
MINPRLVMAATLMFQVVVLVSVVVLEYQLDVLQATLFDAI